MTWRTSSSVRRYLVLGPRGRSWSPRAPLLEVALFDLEIALFGVVVLLGGGGGSQAVALPFDEHHEFVGDDIVGEDGEGTGVAQEGGLRERQGEHG